MEFTESQKKVIETADGSMVVSAGAGSGKTTVMTKRILESVKKGGDINRYLIVTFTKAAAADVREKLYKELMKAQAQNTKDRHIAKQLMSLPSADISTIHGFCFSVIRQSFSLLGISPDVRAADEAEANALLSECGEKAVNALFERDDDTAKILADAFCGRKSDKALTETLKDLYTDLRVYPHPLEFYGTLFEKMERDASAQSFEQTEVCGDFVKEIGRVARSAAEQAEYIHRYAMGKEVSAKCKASAEKTIELASDLVEILPAGYTAVKEWLSVFKAPTLSHKSKEDEEISQMLSPVLASLKELPKLLVFSDEQNLQAVKDNYIAAREMLTLLKDLDNRYTQAKRKEGVLDFSDQEHFMLSLLEKEGQSTPLCIELKSRFDRIYIDEYQDTNPLQDRIFSLISDNNRFMVGDVKQSIYRFRSAHPEIFRNYCKTFGTLPDTHKVNLRENFRCDNPVISFCNMVFESDGELSKDMNYAEESLVFAKSENVGETPVTVGIIKKSEKMSEEEARTAEALYIGEKIKEMVGTPKNDGTPMTYGDIAVLFSALKTNLPVYGRVFRQLGIPFKSEKSENFLEKAETLVAICALKAVDNPLSDISLAGLMRSPIGGFTADELYTIKKASRADSFYGCLEEACVPEIKRVQGKKYTFKSVRRGVKGLWAKCREFLKKLNAWRDMAENMPVHKFIWEFYAQSGLASKVQGEKDGKKRYRNLVLLYEYARKYEESSYKGLSAFIKYLTDAETLEEANQSDSDGNTVKLMTVHHSKGLEFPAVFLADTDRQFKLKDSGKYVLRSDGLAFKISYHNGMYTPANCVVKSLLLKETADRQAEEGRKLYVALTRARERLFVTAKAGYAEEGYKPFTYPCQSRWVVNAAEENKNDCDFFIIEVRDAQALEQADTPQESVKQLPVDCTDYGYLKFEYGYGGTDFPAKISVSEIRPGLLEEEEYTKTPKQTRAAGVPKFIREQAGTAADKGTANHLFMQFADFEIAKKEPLSEANRLFEKGFITKEQLDLMDFEAIHRFFESDLYIRMTSAKKLYREKRFSVEESNRILGGDGKDTVLVQGVIDCFFMKNDGTYTVVDYKTDNVTDKDVLIKRHKLQLGFYKSAVERMTGGKVSETVIYSFKIGEVKVEM